jgi:cobyrinic acid a,c-diamide synthase
VRALEQACRGLDVAVLGHVPRLPELELPDRHLGLVQAMEHDDLEAFLALAAAKVAEHVDVAALRALARPATLVAPQPSPALPPLGQRIALAADTAFAFAYPHLLDDWRRQGAEIAPFSPLADEPPEAGADAVFLPGGYPELHAGRLAANAGFLDGLRQAARRNAAIYGECGGYMVLGQGLVDAEGSRHAMAGLLGLETSFAERRLHLGYRVATLEADGPLGKAGARYRGHEFHYASVLDEGPEAPLFACADALGTELGPVGRRRGPVMGSFMHLIEKV